VLAETATTAVFSLLSMLAIGRVIGPEAAGTGMIAIAAFALLDIIASTLFPDSLVQRPGLQPRHVASALKVAVLAGIGTGLALAASGPLLAGWTGVPLVAALCLALAPLLPLSAFAGAASGPVLREQRFAVLACRVLIGQPLALGVGLWMAATGWGAWAMIGNQAAATLTAFLVLLLAGRLPLRPPVSRAALADLWPVALPQMAAIMVMMGRYRLFLLALGLIASEAVLAVSHFAFRMLDAAVMVVAQTTGRIALPRLCALQGDRDAQAEAFGDLAQLQALLGMPLAAGIALTAPDLVAVVLGPAWAGAGQAAQIVGCAALFGFIHGEPFSLFVARGRARWNLIINAVALAVPLVALLLLRPETPSEAAFAWAAQSLLLPPVFTWLVLREMRRPLSWLLARIAPAIVATAAMAVVVVTMQQALGLGPGAELAASAATGLVTYAVVAFALLRGRPPRALRRQPALA
jgi:PST family polysaccharide transporter